MVSQVRQRIEDQVLDLLYVFNEDDHVTCLECAEGAMDIFVATCPGCAVHIFAMTNYSRFDIPNTLFLTMQEPPDAELTQEHYNALTTPLHERSIIRWETGEVFIPATCSREEYGVLLLMPNPKPVPLPDNLLNLIAASLAQKWAFRLEFGRGRIMNEVSLELTEVMESVYGAVMKFVCAPPRPTAIADLWEGAETLIQRKIHEMAQELVPCDQIALWMVEGDELVIHNNDLRIRSHAVREFAGRVLIAGTPLSSSEPQEISQLGPYSTTLCIPIIVNGDVVAILQFIDKFNCTAPTRRYSDLVETVDRTQREYRPPSRRSSDNRSRVSDDPGVPGRETPVSFKDHVETPARANETTASLPHRVSFQAEIGNTDETEECGERLEPRILSVYPRPVACANPKNTFAVLECSKSDAEGEDKPKAPQTAMTLSRALAGGPRNSKTPSGQLVDRKQLEFAAKRKLKTSKTMTDLASSWDKKESTKSKTDAHSVLNSTAGRSSLVHSLVLSTTGGSDVEYESLFIQDTESPHGRGIQKKKKKKKGTEKCKGGPASIISRELKSGMKSSSQTDRIRMSQATRLSGAKYQPTKDAGFNGFTACDIEVASILVSGPIFLALRAASLAAKLAREKRNAIAANSFNRAMSSALRLPEITEMLCKQVATILRAEHCVFFFAEESKRQLWSPPTEYRSFLSVDYDKTILGHVVRTETLYITNNPAECPLWDQSSGKWIHGENYAFTHIMAAPVLDISTKKVIAAVQVLNKIQQTSNVRMMIRQKNAGFSIFDGELLQVLCKEAAIHMQRVSYDVLEMRARRDEERHQENNLNNQVTGSMKSLVQMHFGRERAQRNLRTLRTLYGLAATTNSISDLPRGDTLGPGHPQKPQHRSSTRSRPSVEFLTRNKLNVDAHIDFFALDKNDDFELIEKVCEISEVRQHLNCDQLHFFIKNLRDGYLRNPYHNWFHALQCFHQCYLVSTQLSLFSWDDYGFSLPMRVGLLIGSVAHDVGHRGRGNPFEIATESVLSCRYNDRSVLENHHCATLYTLLRQRDIFSELDKETRLAIREVIVDAILQTDMIHHSVHVQELAQNFDPEEPLTRGATNAILHACDIGAYNLPVHIAAKFARSVMMEFTQQCEDERRLDLPVTPFMDGLDEPKRAAFSQVGFLDYVVFPLWTQMGSLRPALDLQYLHKNKQLWQDISNAPDQETARQAMDELAPPWTKAAYFTELLGSAKEGGTHIFSPRPRLTGKNLESVSEELEGDSKQGSRSASLKNVSPEDSSMKSEPGSTQDGARN